jgi:hypothetical protein
MGLVRRVILVFLVGPVRLSGLVVLGRHRGPACHRGLAGSG